jgi:S-adenosylmethionine:tRNA ribosyltransferase-isomerase
MMTEVKRIQVQMRRSVLSTHYFTRYFSRMYSLNDYHYDLPAELIAQQPALQRDRSQLLCLDRRTGHLSHTTFNAIGDYLRTGDVLVINNTAVIPGRLEGKKITGGRVEVLIADYAGGRKPEGENGRFICRCLVKASKRPQPGSWLKFADELKAKVIDSNNGLCTLEFHAADNFETMLDKIGQVPLPPYIKRNSGMMSSCDDGKAYQTVYAARKGAVAAPTAGLHFTPELLSELKAGGIQIVELTLHVGYGTFMPVRVADIRRHQMHSEQFSISGPAAEAINSARRTGRRVVAVGTTCVRALEYAADASGKIEAGGGRCDLFIYPGYRFKIVDALVTNFHLPKSTLLMLVAAFAGRQNIFDAYHEAVKRRYRFYSYGDAMFIY